MGRPQSATNRLTITAATPASAICMERDLAEQAHEDDQRQGPGELLSLS